MDRGTENGQVAQYQIASECPIQMTWKLRRVSNMEVHHLTRCVHVFRFKSPVHINHMYHHIPENVL